MNNLIIINSKTFSELILWMIQLLISPYALEGGVVSNFGLDQIGSGRPWFYLLHYCRENLLRFVYWEILTMSPLLRIIQRVVQCQLSIQESSTGNHLLKIFIIVLKIVLSSLLTLNTLRIDTLSDLIAEVSSTIPVINRTDPVLVLFPSLLGGLTIFGNLRSWYLYCLGLGLSFHLSGVLYQ